MTEPVFQYRFSERLRHDGSKSERHDWCLVGDSGAINIWAEPSSGGWGGPWYGGVECHWTIPPGYYEGSEPHQEHCWLLDKPCWHDGTSLYFSERIAPCLPDPTGKQMDGSRNDFLLYHLRDWFSDKIAAQVDRNPEGENGEAG